MFRVSGSNHWPPAAAAGPLLAVGTGSARGHRGGTPSPEGTSRAWSQGRAEADGKQIRPGGTGLWSRAAPSLTQLAQLWEPARGRPGTCTQRAGGCHPFAWAMPGSAALPGGAGPCLRRGHKPSEPPKCPGIHSVTSDTAKLPRGRYLGVHPNLNLY